MYIYIYVAGSFYLYFPCTSVSRISFFVLRSWVALSGSGVVDLATGQLPLSRPAIFWHFHGALNCHTWPMIDLIILLWYTLGIFGNTNLCEYLYIWFLFRLGIADVRSASNTSDHLLNSIYLFLSAIILLLVLSCHFDRPPLATVG